MEARKQLAMGLVWAADIVGPSAIQKGRGGQIFEEWSEQNLVRD
jgi:hypothetical protein